MDLRPWLAVLVVATAVHTMGCGLIGGCGVGPAPGPDNQDGTVTFDAAVGASQELPVPFQDSADVTDTITSASLTGPDAAAFEVLSTFPMTIPAGTQVTVKIRFAPEHTGDSTATLVLETEMMGPSSIDLDGTGTAGG
jgi:hypothetical protein